MYLALRANTVLGRSSLHQSLGLRMRFPFGRSKSVRANSSKLQELVDALKRMPGDDLDEANIQRIKEIIGHITTEELGLEDYASAAAQAKQIGGTVKSSFLSRLTRRSKPPAKKMSYISIAEHENFSIAVFCFPGPISLPMHDHPGMTVFSRVIFGTVGVKGYDWLKEHGRSLGPDDPKPADKTVDRILTGKDATVVLRPTSGGNIHGFTTEEHSAILDILWPPYSQKDGRNCTYYKLAPETPDGTIRLVVEENAPVPDMIEDKYRGVVVDV